MKQAGQAAVIGLFYLGRKRPFFVFFTSIDFFRKKLMCNAEYFFIIEVVKIFQKFADSFL